MRRNPQYALKPCSELLQHDHRLIAISPIRHLQPPCLCARPSRFGPVNVYQVLPRPSLQYADNMQGGEGYQLAESHHRQIELYLVPDFDAPSKPVIEAASSNSKFRNFSISRYSAAGWWHHLFCGKGKKLGICYSHHLKNAATCLRSMPDRGRTEI